MSVRLLISKQSKITEGYRDRIKEIIPKSKEFKSPSGKKPFSKDYVLRAPYDSEYTPYAGLVGTAFDYLAKFIIGQTISNKKELSYSDMQVEITFLSLKGRISESTYQDLIVKFYTGMDLVKDFVHSNAEITNDLIEYALFLAKVENVYTSKDRSEDKGKKLLRELPQFLSEDLFNLCNIFIESNIVHQNSEVVFSPNFLDIMSTQLGGGAEADIYIDGTLWDFKTNKSHGYKGMDIIQITSYYIFNQICEDIKGVKNNITPHKIDRIGIYMARYGESPYIDVETLDKAKLDDIKEYLREHILVFNRNYTDNFPDIRFYPYDTGDIVNIGKYDLKILESVVYLSSGIKCIKEDYICRHVHLEITNVSSDTISIDENIFEFTALKSWDSIERPYYPSKNTSSEVEIIVNKITLNKSIKPGETSVGEIIIEVPRRSCRHQLHIKDSEIIINI